MSTDTRREFLGRSLAAAAGAVILPRVGRTFSPAAREAVLEVPEDGYPLIDVKGSHRDIGMQIGSAMGERITGHLELSPDYRSSVEFLEGEGRETVEKMLAHARREFPHLVEEVEGMADALDIPFERLFAFQCRAEISVLKDAAGCSTIALCDGDRMILAHNEDGNDLNIGGMFLVKATPPSGVTFLSFVYPGLLPGNGPSMNEAGLVQTTNYIQPRGVADGIPRYIIGRAILEAKSLDDAVALATMTPRAFSYHHNLAWFPDRRIVSVEVAAYPQHKHSIKNVEWLYVHTNHFIHPDMTSTDTAGPKPYDVPYGRPYSPCRHPEGDVHGVTLGTAVFEAPARAMTLYHGNPCRGFRREYAI
ncbi:MAG: C45 family autoproteolytic acyltransferase/hydrolase [bacterium]